MKTDLELLILLKMFIEDHYINGDEEIYCLCFTTDLMELKGVLSSSEERRLDNCLAHYNNTGKSGFWWPQHELQVRYDFVLECIEKESKKPLIQ